MSCHTWSHFDELDPASLGDLLACSDFASVFQTREWLSAWWETFRRPSWELRLVGEKDGDRLTAFAPLFLDRRENRMSFVGVPHGDYGLLITPRDAPDGAAALIAHLQKLAAGGTTIELAQIPAQSVCAAHLRALSEHSFRVSRARDHVCPALPLTANAVSAAVQKKSARRHAADLRRLGNVTVKHLATEAEIMPWLDRFFQQHVDRWAGTGFPSLFLNAANRQFYGRLVHLLAPAGRLIFTIILVDGEAVAFHFGLGFSRTYYWYKPTFDVRYSRASPGEFLLLELFAMALERGYARFDFGRGDEPFKRRYASEYPENENFVLFPGTYSRVHQIVTHQLDRVHRRVLRTLSRG